MIRHRRLLTRALFARSKPSTAGTASIRLSCRAMRAPGRAVCSPALLCACLPDISGWATGTALTRPTNTSLSSLRIRKYRVSTARKVLLSSIYTKWRRRPERPNCALPLIGISLRQYKNPKKGGSHENDEAARPHSSDRFCDWLHSDSRRWFYPTRATEAETGCRLQWRAAIQGRSFLAEAAAESL